MGMIDMGTADASGRLRVVVADSVGALMRHYRKQRRMTQERLAELIGKDQNYISLVETGRIKVPSQPILMDIAGALNIPVAEMYQAAGWGLPPDREGTEERAEAEPDIDLADPELHFWASTARELTPEESAAVKEIVRQILKSRGKDVG